MSSKRYRLITEGSEHQRRTHGATLVVPGPSQGGPAQLQGSVTDRFIEAERAGAHTVLLAGSLPDLDADIAAVCRYVVTDQAEVEEEATARYGSERVLRTTTVRIDNIHEWIGRLPVPEAHTLRRRIRTAARRLPFAEAVYSRIVSDT